jgi:hypothetical protein
MNQDVIKRRERRFSGWFLLAGMLVATNTLTGQIRNNAQVLDENNVSLAFPWAGGMNSIQFGDIDLDRDGLKDLLAFDRNGNRVMCFVNQGIYDAVHYDFRPDLAGLIPQLSDWAIFKDYDGDGRTDIFTYSPGWAGMKVYRNISDNILKFDLVVYPFLETFQENGYVNLLVTNVDYPGIADIDFDGDLDILSFWGLGSFVNYHKNMSMEKYGTADSLDFALEEYCWGFFAESEESNALYFDTCFIDGNPLPAVAGDERHTGSTFQLIDLDNDTVMDLLLGDVDYPGIFALHNSGDKYEAFISSADTNFPATTQKIRLFSFPVTEYIDVNNDLIKDLVVSSFEPGLEASKSSKSVWWYRNTGTDTHPHFVLEQRDFLQEDMIDRGSGAYPVLYDWDGDGLLDIFIGNFGFYQYSYYENFFLRSVYHSRIGYYRNTGTAQQAQFKPVDDDFGGLGSLETQGLIPTFEDLDNDGDVDMLAGYKEGKLILAVNNQGDLDVITENYQDINVGEFSAPQLFDLDRDGLKDLVVGEKAGNLNYYRNTGSAGNPVFEFVTDSLGKVNVTDLNVSWDGYSVPYFFRLSDDITRLLVGSEQGKIFYYEDIDGNLEGRWTESDKLEELLDTTNVSFDRGARTAAAIGIITQDGKPEMLAGNYSGGLEYFNGNAEVLPGMAESSTAPKSLKIYPNPAGDYARVVLDNIAAPSELVVISTRGSIVYSGKIETASRNHLMLNTGSFTNGIYIVHVRTAEEVYYEKLVIRR